jgi:hypothetical protein
MNTPNLKNIEKKNSFSEKDLQIGEFNQKLDSIILDIQSKEKTFKSNIDSINEDRRTFDQKNLQKEISYIAESNNRFSEEKIKDNNGFNNLQKIRLNFKLLMESDMFANNYDLIPSIEIYERMNDYNNNVEFDLPYCKMFNDQNLLKDESIFTAFDDEYQDKYIDKEDIKKIKTENIDLNFGKDPYEIYGLVQEGKININDKQSIEFFNSLNFFNIFKSKNPYYINFDMNMGNDNNFYNSGPIHENCFNNNNSKIDKEQIYMDNFGSNIETRPNSGNFIDKEPIININSNDYSFNENLYINNDNKTTIIKGKEKKTNKYINRKRNNI